MLRLSEWERKNFSASNAPDLTVIFPSREIYFSRPLLHTMHLNDKNCPKTLDQWYELCHPEDHANISRLEQILSSRENFVSIIRRLYCGDGYYRSFRLDAFIQRDTKGRATRLIGTETSALRSWLNSADEGDTIECEDVNGRVRRLEAVRVQGVMTLRDVGELEDMMNENERLRREIQRRIFAGTRSDELVLDDSDGREGLIRGSLEENINLALNVLTGNNQLKALRRTLNEPSLTIGIAGLTSSGKSTFMNALLGERLIPEQTRATTNIPIICREGESRLARVIYQDGRVNEVRGHELNASYMRNIAAENFSAGNRSGIARVEISMPGAMIPEGFSFVDTPGADALAGSGGSALRNILPEFDIVLYITPVRSRLKGSDYEFLKGILAMNQRVVFVLSQIDLERDDTEAGRVIHSAEAKILGDIHALRDEMMRFSGLDVDVIPVSSKKALESFYDRKSVGWTDSNIEAVMNYLAPLTNRTVSRAMTLRTERTLKILENALTQGKVTGSSRWRLQDTAEKLRAMLRANEGMPVLRNTYTSGHDESSSSHQGLLGSLLESMREGEFRNRFFGLDAFAGRRKAVLLGPERNQSMKLFARLAHNLMMENLPEGEVSRHEWLCSGHSAPFGCISLPVIGEGYSVVIGPSDSDIRSHVDWHKLFREYTPVVSVDLSRVDSGLSDLAHSPYITGLALTDWVLAFGNAGLFDTRQIDLVSQVPERLNEFIETNGLKSPECFIFEGYKIFSR